MWFIALGNGYHKVFMIISFIHLFISKMEWQEKREGSPSSWFTPQCNSQGWSRLTPRAWTLHRSSHPDSKSPKWTYHNTGPLIKHFQKKIYSYPISLIRSWESDKLWNTLSKKKKKKPNKQRNRLRIDNIEPHWSYYLAALWQPVKS